MAVVAIFAPPEGVYIYDGERPVALFGDLYFPGLSPVVDKFMRVEKLAPPAPPPLGIVPSKNEAPLHRIMGRRTVQPGPDHVGMEHAEKQAHVLGVPAPRFPVDDLPYL